MFAEALSAVTNINLDIFESINHEIPSDEGFTFFHLEICSDGNAGGFYSAGILVKFCGEIVWSSENDERTYIGSEDDYESVEIFLRRRVKEILQIPKEILEKF
jgi:hypothetical protein